MTSTEYAKYREEPFNLSSWGWKKQYYEQELWQALESFNKGAENEAIID